MSRSRRDFDFERPEIDPSKLIGPLGIGAIVLLLVILGFWSIFTVEPNEEAVVLRFGKHLKNAEPGLHFRIPIVDTVFKVSTEERNIRLPVDAEGTRPDRGVSEEDTLMLTGDLNAASVEWTIQWKITEPRKYIFAFDDSQVFERVIRTVAQTVMNRLVGDYSIDEILTAKRGEVAAEARESTQRTLDNLVNWDSSGQTQSVGVGVAITDLQMQRVTPPNQVKPAFDAVNAAIQTRDRLENEANRERNRLLPQARAERDKKIREAEGYSDRRRAEVDGEIAALRAKFRAYDEARDVTRERRYLEAMQNVLGNVNEKVIIDADLQQLLPLLNLNN
jgi:membrane protease subunit HflK